MKTDPDEYSQWWSQNKKWLVTFIMVAVTGHAGLGTALAVFGPTQPYLGKQVGVDVDTVNFIWTARFLIVIDIIDIRVQKVAHPQIYWIRLLLTRHGFCVQAILSNDWQEAGLSCSRGTDHGCLPYDDPVCNHLTSLDGIGDKSTFFRRWTQIQCCSFYLGDCDRHWFGNV